MTLVVNFNSGIKTEIADGKDQVIAVDGTMDSQLVALFNSNRTDYNIRLGVYENSSLNLHLSTADFNHLAGTVFAEASVNPPWEEAAGICSVLKNRAVTDGNTIIQQAQSSAGVYGAARAGEILRAGQLTSRVKNVYSGVARSIVAYQHARRDFSNGGFYWHGLDFRRHTAGSSAYESFYLSGFKFTDPAHDQWGMGDHASGRRDYTYKYESTAFYGSTIFMRLTSQWMGLQGRRTRWNGSQAR